MRCGAACQPNVTTYDVDQAFESCRASDVVRSFDVAASRFTAVTGFTSLLIARGKRVVAKVSLRYNPARFWKFEIPILRRALEVGLLLRFVCIGPLVFALEGLCIGGILSKPAVSLVLGEKEVAFRADVRRLAELGLSQFFQNCAILRYVDDGVVCTKCYCPCCVKFAVQQMYLGLPISFPDPGLVDKNWLDVLVSVGGPFSFYLAFPNKNTDWLRNLGPRGKLNVLPCFGSPAFPVQHFSAILAGKISRIEVLQVDPQFAILAALEFSLELLFLGYPRCYVRGVLHACRRSNPVVAAQHIFRQWLSSCA
jgi:hypothetical protein